MIKNSSNKDPWIKSKYQKDFDLTLGEVLRSIRKSLGYSRETLLSKLSDFYDGDQPISDDYYGRIERGERSISAYKLLLLIQYLNIAIDNSNDKNGTNIKKIDFDQLLVLIKKNK